MRRFLLGLSLLVSAAACTPADDDDGFTNYRFDGGVSMQICVGVEHGVSGAEVEVANLDTGSIFADYTTDGEGFFEMDSDFPESDSGFEIVGHKGRYEARSVVSAVRQSEIEPACLNTDDVVIAVADGAHDSPADTLDSMERQFNRLEVGGAAQSDLLTVLTYPASLNTHDVVMLGSGLDDAVDSEMDEIVANLQDFVQAGGSVYASDHAYEIVLAMDPGSFEVAGVIGEPGEASVSILDSALRSTLDGVTQPTMRLAADDEDRSWAVVDSVRDDVEVLISANVSHLLPEPAGATPLVMVWSPYGDEGGRIVYSSVVNPGDGSVNGETWRMFMEVVLRL